VWADEHDRALRERHATFGQIVFWVVIAMAVSGAAMAWYQLLNEVPAPAQTSRGGRDPQALEGERFLYRAASRMLGIATLLLSMVFLYTYLVNVYPATVPDAARSAPRTRK